MGKVVGIDLGTTNSLVAYVGTGGPIVIRDGAGDGLVPSIVSLGRDEVVYVGREAQRRFIEHQHTGLLHERTGDGNFLEFPPAHCIDMPQCEPGEVELFDNCLHLQDIIMPYIPANPWSPPQKDRIKGGYPGRFDMLGNIRNRLCDLPAGRCEDVLFTEHDSSRLRYEHGIQAAQQCRLAGTVWSEDGDNLSGNGFTPDIPQHGMTVVPEREVFHVQDHERYPRMSR